MRTTGRTRFLPRRSDLSGGRLAIPHQPGPANAGPVRSPSLAARFTPRAACHPLRVEEPLEHVVVVFSGDLASTVLAYQLRAHGSDLTLLTVEADQRSRRAGECATRTADALGAPHQVVDLSALADLWSNSPVGQPLAGRPDGEDASSPVRALVVPPQSVITLDIAVAVASMLQAGAVAFAAHADDDRSWPGCGPGFLDAYTRMVAVAGQGVLAPGFAVLAPLLGRSLAEIVTAGAALGVPFADTWSCDQATDTHCGTCGACTPRRAAFHHAGVPDPTRYSAVG